MPFLLSCPRLRWIGHIARLGDDRLPKQMLFGKLSASRPAGGPLLRWSDCVKKDLKHASIPEDSWLELAQDADTWKKLSKDGLSKWEADIMSRPIQVSDIVNTSTIFSCTVDACGRQFLSHRGLAQHIPQKHRPTNTLISPVVLDAQSLGTSLQSGSTTSSSSLFVCPTCGKEYKSKSGLTRHSKSHTIPSDGPNASSSSTFICGSCGKIKVD